MSKADNEVLAAIHKAMADDLLRKVQSGEATAAELNVARQFLRDNNINTVPTRDNGLQDLHEALPFPGDTDDESEFKH